MTTKHHSNIPFAAIASTILALSAQIGGGQ